MDFEEELESHYIRKDILRDEIGARNENIPAIVHRDMSTIHEYIPSTLKQLTNLKESGLQQNSIICFLEGNIKFKNCLVYGDIVEKIRELDNRYVYTLDDGTACLEISLFQKKKNMANITKLQRNLCDIELNEKKIVNSLQNILSTTKHQFNTSTIRPGTKALLYGKPTIYNNKVSLDVYNILQDNEVDRSVEIAFKDELVDWHKRYILK
ncbi:verrocchio [Haematobia irritans]|uniref:verrocchio n=1 Tax=Haematobia irritans TaxID=7368 RepID=UPI003F4F81F0